MGCDPQHMPPCCSRLDAEVPKSRVLGVPVIVHDHRSRLPVHPQVPVLPPFDVVVQEAQQGRALLLLQPDDPLGVQPVDVQRQLLGDWMNPHYWMDRLDWFSYVPLPVLVDRGLREARMNCLQAVE